MVIKAVFFDLNDVIYDSNFSEEMALSITLKMLEDSFPTIFSLDTLVTQYLELYENLKKNGESPTREIRFQKLLEPYFESLRELITVQEISSLLSKMLQSYEIERLTSAYEYKLSRTFFKYLNEKGIKTGIITNGPRSLTDQILAKTGILEYVGIIVASLEVGIRKPSPEIYLLTAHSLDIAPVNCLFIDDKEENVIGAISVGMKGEVFHHETNPMSRIKRKYFGIEYEPIYYQRTFDDAVIMFSFDIVTQQVLETIYSKNRKPIILRHGYSELRRDMSPRDVALEGNGVPFPIIPKQKALNIIAEYSNNMENQVYSLI